MNHDRSSLVSRRVAVGAGAVAAAATALAPWSTNAEQDAGAAEPELLFIQSFSGGTLAPAAPTGAFTLTLTGSVSRTLYFSDRPERLAGIMPTVEFIDTLATIEADPPNAALVAELATGTDAPVDASWVVTLVIGAYDGESRELRYDLRLIEPADTGDTRFAVTPDEAPSGPVELGEGHLFSNGLNKAIIVTNLTGRDIPVVVDRR